MFLNVCCCHWNVTSHRYAETYHQQYLAKPGNRQYCSAEPTGVKLPDFSQWPELSEAQKEKCVSVAATSSTGSKVLCFALCCVSAYAFQYGFGFQLFDCSA